MTHDELLAEITLRQGMETGLHAFKAWLALRAVVEFHKPEHSIRGYRCVFDNFAYPCPTIRVIEKELL